MTASPPISFEFFPPNTPVGSEKLRTVVAELAAVKPEFFSVTYGAGGSTRDKTLATVRDIAGLGHEAVPHLSCIGSTRQGIAELLAVYRAQGIRRLVALRGDLPSGQMTLGELPYARDLVAFVREHSGDHFHIEVAAYPEMHPQADSYEADLRNFIAKVQAGANSAITQFFFNADAYWHFMDRLARAGVNIPVIPGIMPITNASNLIRFSDSCGADIPRWLRKQLLAYGDDSASIKALGETVVARLIEELIQGGAPAFHFYTMNQTEATTRLVKLTGLA